MVPQFSFKTFFKCLVSLLSKKTPEQVRRTDLLETNCCFENVWAVAIKESLHVKTDCCSSEIVVTDVRSYEMVIQVCTALAVISQLLTQEACFAINASTAMTPVNVFVSAKALRRGTCEHAILSTSQILSGFAREMNDVTSL